MKRNSLIDDATDGGTKKSHTIICQARGEDKKAQTLS